MGDEAGLGATDSGRATGLGEVGAWEACCQYVDPGGQLAELAYVRVQVTSGNCTDNTDFAGAHHSQSNWVSTPAPRAR
jgi:hypothetical protein